MKVLFDQMLEKYKLETLNDKTNAVKEIMQEIVLCGLSRAKFFEKAVFYGGTALRIFYGLDRFSEDLDFSLKTEERGFALNSYFPALERETKALGLNVIIEEKEKANDSFIKSAFLKGNTREHLLSFYSDNELIKGINCDQIIKIKCEVDTSPPPYATYEYKYRLLPSAYGVGLYDLPSLFAGKIHAVICRSWQNRVKGRDLYDYVFYMQNNAKVNLRHLQARLEQTGFLGADIATLNDIKALLCDKFDKINYEQAQNDIQPFVKDVTSLDVWNADFFKQITSALQER